MIKIFLVKTAAHNGARGHTWVYYTDTTLSLLHPSAPPPPSNNGPRLSLHNILSSAMTKIHKAKQAIEDAPPGVGMNTPQYTPYGH